MRRFVIFAISFVLILAGCVQVQIVFSTPTPKVTSVPRPSPTVIMSGYHTPVPTGDMYVRLVNVDIPADYLVIRASPSNPTPAPAEDYVSVEVEMVCVADQPCRVSPQDFVMVTSGGSVVHPVTNLQGFDDYFKPLLTDTQLMPNQHLQGLIFFKMLDGEFIVCVTYHHDQYDVVFTLD